MLTATTQALACVQRDLHRIGGLFHAETALRMQRGKYPAQVHRDTAMRLQRALVEEWRLQQFLPTEAANDLPDLPGVA